MEVIAYTSGDAISSTGIIVNLLYAGSGINGVDYTTGASQIIIPAGLTGVSFFLTGINDNLIEGAEDVVIEIS